MNISYNELQFKVPGDTLLLTSLEYKLSLMCKFRTFYHADHLGENFKLLVIALLNHYLGLCHCIHSVLGHLGR